MIGCHVVVITEIDLFALPQKPTVDDHSAVSLVLPRVTFGDRRIEEEFPVRPLLLSINTIASLRDSFLSAKLLQFLVNSFQ